MNGTTHAAVGAVAALAIWHGQPLPSAFPLMCIGAAAALLPDVDHHASIIGRRVMIGALIFHHRGFTHSAAALVLIVAACWSWQQPAPLAVAVGYASHLFLDALNPQGIPLFWPLRWRWRGLFITSGLIDHLIGFCAGLGVFVLLAWMSTGRGF